MGTLSVVMPCFNEEATVLDAAERVLASRHCRQPDLDDEDLAPESASGRGQRWKRTFGTCSNARSAGARSNGTVPSGSLRTLGYIEVGAIGSFCDGGRVSDTMRLSRFARQRGEAGKSRSSRPAR
jgi:hypothetical protein